MDELKKSINEIIESTNNEAELLYIYEFISQYLEPPKEH